MRGIVIALPGLEDGKKIRRILEQNGFEIYGVFTKGASVLHGVENLDGGVVISGYRLSDMHYSQLLSALPKSFELLLVGSAKTVAGSGAGIIALTIPLRTCDLVDTLQMILKRQGRERRGKQKVFKKRTEQEENYIANAKRILMERNHLTEEEAHRYLQKASMDTETGMVETAQMVITLFYNQI